MHLVKPLRDGWLKWSIRRPLNNEYTRLSDVYSGLLHKFLQNKISAGEFFSLAKERIKQD